MRHPKLKDFLVLTLAISAMFNYAFAQKRLPELSEKDKIQLLKGVLTDAQNRFETNSNWKNLFRNCQNLTLKDKRVVFLSIENIERNFVPEIFGVHLELVSKDEINAEVENNGRLCYLNVRGFTQDKEKVTLNVDKVELTTGGCKGCVKGFYALSLKYEGRKLKKWQVEYKSNGEIVN